ncbi:MAG TPA: hypothetical protein VNX28_15290 [Gemmataceae bacterium]|jgi:hypothetical protein|nr:hypothetical protein [Gemmataceae bacterium]
MVQQGKRFRVQFYTERYDGTREWCVCDFGREAETGLSPKVMLDGNWQYSTADEREAEVFAAALNSGELKPTYASP